MEDNSGAVRGGATVTPQHIRFREAKTQNQHIRGSTVTHACRPHHPLHHFRLLKTREVHNGSNVISAFAWEYLSLSRSNDSPANSGWGSTL